MKPTLLTDEEIMYMYNEPSSDAEAIAFAREVEAAVNARCEAENQRLLAKLVECRSSVKSHIYEYDRFMMRKEPHANQCDRDEQIRLHDLLNWIDDNAALKGHPV